MRFAHLADCHVGSWREPKLRELSSRAFSGAVDVIIERRLDFVIIAGDLFHTSIPGLDVLRSAVSDLVRLKRSGIPVYLVAGSHDFSPSGRTMLDVLEEAGLFVNVCRGKEADGRLRLEFTVDERTGVKIAGLLGRRASLEKSYFEALDKRYLEDSEGFKIFVFHSAISELKPGHLAGLESSPLSLLPKGFDYYAAGHVHVVLQRNEKDYGIIAYPGPLFPDNFRELELLDGRGGFFIYDNGRLSFEPVNLCNYSRLFVDCNGLSPEQVDSALAAAVRGKEFHNAIVTLRVEGALKSGRVSDIDFSSFVKRLYEKGAFFVMKNAFKLLSPDFAEVKVSASGIDDVEARLVREHLGKVRVRDFTAQKEESITLELMSLLSREKDEGEKAYEFERRIREDVERVLK